MTCRSILTGIVALTALVVLGPGHAAGRLVENWPYKRLLREADLVVIARPVANADSGERTREKGWKTEFLGVNTDFEVQAVLKGKPDGDKLQVLHFRLPKGVRIVNGPGFVWFRLKAITLRTKSGTKIGFARPHYLLFLTRRKDGRYEPISGRIDPCLSVQEMYHPLGKEAAEKAADD